jgi:hypothetical protein
MYQIMAGRIISNESGQGKMKRNAESSAVPQWYSNARDKMQTQTLFSTELGMQNAAITEKSR